MQDEPRVLGQHLEEPPRDVGSEPPDAGLRQVDIGDEEWLVARLEHDGGQRLTSPDIRAGMAILIAALCANGRSVIGNVAEIDRGYERIDDRLRALGAQIERVET